MTITKTGQYEQASGGAGSGDLPLFGMLMALLAFLSLSFMTLFAKLLSETYHVIEIAFWRNIVALLPFAVMLAFPSRRWILRIRSRPGVIALRAVVGSVNVLMVFGAFSLLPLANATSVLFASALFMPILGMIFLGETVGPYRAMAVMLGFVGVVIVAQPGSEGSWNLLGTGLALASALIVAMLGIILRVLGQSEAPETVTFYFLLIGTLFLAPAMAFVAQGPNWEDIPYFLGLGAAGFLMQICSSTAYKYAAAALVAPLKYTQIIWATLLGWLVFAEVPTINIFAGAAIIILSSLIVIMRERYLARKGRLKRQATDESIPQKPI